MPHTAAATYWRLLRLLLVRGREVPACATGRVRRRVYEGPFGGRRFGVVFGTSVIGGARWRFDVTRTTRLCGVSYPRLGE